MIQNTNTLLLKRTTSEDSDFQNLVKLLDSYLAIIDGKDHTFYDQYNKIDAIKNVVVCYQDGIAIGCGAFKEYDPETVEVKRMFVIPDARGNGIGSMILKELELWANELNYKTTVLETGKRQKEAVALYQKSGYAIIPNYGQYTGVENSVCMRKTIDI